MGDLYVKGKKVSGTVSSASAVTYKDRAGNKHTLQKVLDNRPVNNNLLINSNFANPVNQRGFTSVELTEYGTYTIDRWCIWKNDFLPSPKLILNEGYLTLTGTIDSNTLVPLVFIMQNIDTVPDKDGTYVMSTKINGKIYSKKTKVIPENEAFNDTSTINGVALNLVLRNNNILTICVGIDLSKVQSANIEWVKLELGEVATPYVPRLYEEELELCQRYYQIIHNNLFPWSATTSDMVFHQHFKPMRITPTISIIEAAVYLENQKQSSFKFRTDYKTNRRFNLYATKSSHGLKGKAYVGLFLNVALDAEL